MKTILRLSIALCIALGLLGTIPMTAAQTQTSRLVLAADSDWKFLLGDPAGAEAKAYADGSWRTVNLPHDWSIEGAPEKNNPTGPGGGFFPAGTGWYRKTFTAAPEWKGKRVSVEFDGVYRDATVYLNGRKLGTHPYGYTSFSFDLTPELDFCATNVLAVRVDNSAQPNSRWYSGSGIYRHVRVVVTDPVHVAHWGVFVSTPEVSAAAAKVSVSARVSNDSAKQSKVTVQTTLLGQDGEPAGKTQSTITIAAGSETEASLSIPITQPALWSPESPTLYRAVTQVLKDGKVVDEVTTPFGVRSLSWSAEKGLLLNGKSIKLTGGSVHHDNGPLGAAAFDRAEERKVQLLKAAGMNAVRTAHNPPSEAFLDACDRLGLLVLDEPFDVWEAHKVKFDYGADFDAWWKKDISAMVLRDRNHPSIVIWGIGNEIPELEVEKGQAIGKQLADQVRSLDSTRPLTLAFPGTTTSATAQAVFSQLDITGYNYNILQSYAADHSKLPNRLMVTTESFPSKAFPLWQISKDNPYILGDFTWTAMDYLGESGIGGVAYGTAEQAKMAGLMMDGMSTMVDKMFLGMANGVDMAAAMSQGPADPNMKAMMAVMSPGFPWHAAYCGDLDLTGYRKPQSYYRDILWNGGDRVYATVRVPSPEGKTTIAVFWATYPTLPSWTWPDQAGKDMQVEVYSGTDKVRLYLNDKLIGEQPTGRDQQFKAVFTVPYAPGTLKAVGVRGDRDVAESVLTTVGKPAQLRLTADRTVLQADGQDLSFVTVEALDSEGHWQPDADQDVQFAISGAGVLAAVGNGDSRDTDSYHADRRKLFQGRALVIVRTSSNAGPIHLTATAPGLGETGVSIETKAGNSDAALR